MSPAWTPHIGFVMPVHSVDDKQTIIIDSNIFSMSNETFNYCSVKSFYHKISINVRSQNTELINGTIWLV